MGSAYMRWLTACVLGLPLVTSGAFAQPPPHPHGQDHPDVIIEGTGSRSVRRTTRADSMRLAGSGGVSTTPDNQILVELAPEDTTAANLFDLNGRTLVFTPDGHGGYSRSVQSIIWEDDIGRAVADGEEVQFQSFMFDFAGQRWGSFFVSRRGLITFGEPLTYSYDDIENRNTPMREVAAKFVTTPTISPLYKPWLGGRNDRYGATQHVSSSSDRVVVTWITTEPAKYVHGVPPAEPSRFQLVLRADGSIRFNYNRDVFFGDGIVGLFPDEELTKGDLIASIADARDTELPGHLDLLEVAIYEANTDGLIVEWTTRDPIPLPPSGTRYSYRLHLDADEPYFDGGDEDLDFVWQVDLESDTSHASGGRRFPTDFDNRIALLVESPDAPGISASTRAGAHQFSDNRWITGETLHPVLLDFPSGGADDVDLSRPDSGYSSAQREVFQHPGVPDFDEVTCRLIGTYGDVFDFLVFHVEFRMDSQEQGAKGGGASDNVNPSGTGIDWSQKPALCGSQRLKFSYASWMESTHVFVDPSVRGENRTGFEEGLVLFAHEVTHPWTAYASYDLNGRREPLFGNWCRCHWRDELHAPAAFPWNSTAAGPGGLMGGEFWRENADGTFTPITDYRGGGHSWLDLYMMGLADASEVPDMFILRNLKPVAGTGRRYTGRKEVVSIEQVVAAEGAREPPAGQAQKAFNVGFVYVYLLEPGTAPSDYLLGLHRDLRDKTIEYWSHVTGGRSEMTITVPSIANRAR